MLLQPIARQARPDGDAVAEHVQVVAREVHHALAAGGIRDPRFADVPLPVRNVREHVVGMDDVRPDALRHEALGELPSEELASRRDTERLRERGDVASRFHAEHGNARLPMVPEQVPVVLATSSTRLLGPSECSFVRRPASPRAWLSSDGITDEKWGTR
jgi:hypothetical protein